MKHLRGILISVALLAVAGGGFILFQKMQDRPISNADTQQVAAAPISTKPVATNTVSIQNYTFSPQVITVAKGRTVIWTNNDSTTHTIVFDDATIPSSGALNLGAGFSFAFDHAGTFSYHSAAYPDATGTVIVTDRTD